MVSCLKGLKIVACYLASVPPRVMFKYYVFRPYIYPAALRVYYVFRPIIYPAVLGVYNSPIVRTAIGFGWQFLCNFELTIGMNL